MYKSTLVIAHDITDIEKLFQPEQKDFGRASYTIKKDSKKKELIFSITAKDAIALKIALNTIIKTLSVWERTKEITK